MSSSRLLLLLMLLLMPFLVNAQDQTNGVYRFLNQPSSSRIAALSAPVVSLPDANITDTDTNPAYLDSTHHRQLSFSYTNLFSDVSSISAGGAWNTSNIGTFWGSLKLQEYGSIDKRGVNGEDNGSFSVYDFALQTGFSKSFGKLSTGITINFIHSSIDTYQSSGFTLDGGFIYHFNDRQAVGAAISNVGSQFSAYQNETEPVLPVVHIGYSHKLQYLPLRLSVTLQDITHWEQRTVYDSSAPDFTTNAMRHVALSGEFLFSEHFHVRLGYNSYRNEMIKTDTKIDFSGTSFGVGVNTKYATIDVSRSSNSQLGPVLMLSLTTQL